MLMWNCKLQIALTYLDIFAEVSTKLKKSSTCLKHSYLNFKILKIHFQIHYFGPFWSVKYLIFCQKLLIWTGHHTFPESRHPEVTKNLYYVLSTRQSQILNFLGSSSWTILEVEENFMQSLSAFFITFLLIKSIV